VKESEGSKKVWEFAKKHAVSIGFCGAAGVAAVAGGDLLSASGLLIYAGASEVLNYRSEDVAENLYYRRIHGYDLASADSFTNVAIGGIMGMCLFVANGLIIAGSTGVADERALGIAAISAAVVASTALYATAKIKARSWYNADRCTARRKLLNAQEYSSLGTKIEDNMAHREFWDRYNRRHREY